MPWARRSLGMLKNRIGQKNIPVHTSTNWRLSAPSIKSPHPKKGTDTYKISVTISYVYLYVSLSLCRAGEGGKAAQRQDARGGASFAGLGWRRCGGVAAGPERVARWRGKGRARWRILCQLELAQARGGHLAGELARRKDTPGGASFAGLGWRRPPAPSPAVFRAPSRSTSLRPSFPVGPRVRTAPTGPACPTSSPTWLASWRPRTPGMRSRRRGPPAPPPPYIQL